MTDVDVAARAIAAGDVAAIPTDTVYGLACDPYSRGAVEKIFELKVRPRHSPLPILAHGLSSLEAIARLTEPGRALADAFWPGPLTLVLPRSEDFDAYLGEGAEDTVAVRVPAHDLCLELLARTGPLAVSSANTSGAPPLADAASVRASFAELAILDGGRAAGIASTIVSLVEPSPRVLREGTIGRAEVEGVAGVIG